MANLFGRESELARIDRALSLARAGNGSLALLTGEPGIGKSSIGREVGIRATTAGMHLLSGRCWEGGGAAPYWPWTQVFQQLGSTPFDELLRKDGGDSQQQRFQLFDAAARALAARAGEQPLVVFLDDLHAADLPSLLLLLFVSRQVSASPLFVLGTSRDVETRMSPEVSDALAKIGREGEVVSLPRLTRDNVAAWVSKSESSVSDADDVFRVTEGNPLFVREILRIGAHGKNRLTTDGMKAALDENLRRLSAGARAVLEAAAVLGRDFGSRELAEIIANTHDAVMEHVQLATHLGVLEATERERFQFTHVLLRDRLYETLAPSDRSALHWKAGLVAESHGADPTRVANHLLEGAGAGDAQRAAGSALRAADHALAKLAFEAAAELAERGLTVIGAEASRLACRLEIACGEGMIRSGSIDAGRARCVRAADMAKGLGCAEEQALAALVYGSELTSLPHVSVVMVRLLEEALSALGKGDSSLGAKVGARLSIALTPPRTEEAANRLIDIGLASLAMARRLGHPETLLYALEYARNSFGYMLSSDERFELTREAVALAQVLDQRLTLIKVGPTYAACLLERGLRADADATLTAMIDLHTALDYPQGRWRLPMLRAGFAFFDGRLDEAGQLGDEALALAERAGSDAANIEWANQRIALAIARGEPASIGRDAHRALSMFQRFPFSMPHRAWLLAAIGRRDEALRLLHEAVVIPQALPTLIIVSEACALLEDAESAAPIDEQIQKRCRDFPFFWGGIGAYAFGPTSRARGELARLLGRRDEARRYFEESIALCRRIGAKPFLELSLAALERLEAGGSTGKRAQVDQTNRPAPRDISLRREGDVWAVEGSSGPVFRLKDSKGLSYLSELLAHPGQELHVLALVGLDHGAGDAGPVLDAQAKAAYKQRLDVLEDEIAEADGFGDMGRADRAREELDALATQLAGAIGLGGRDRRAASDAERARINVQRRLKDAIESVGHCDIALGRYLAAAVKTGTYCSFTPL
ncbi:MAG TPA: AAA family ATPase [Polyangia bacterium]|nr:AAA family ATPase [Polyangia bacterium]